MDQNSRHWQALRLAVLPEAVEAVEFALNSLDATGTETELIRSNAPEVVVTGYFDRFPSEGTIRDELHYALRSYGLDESTVRNTERIEIKNTDWLAEWKKHWRPTTIGNFLIAAPWHEVDAPEKIVIRIEPNMAFGTGTHETTQLCLGVIDELHTPGYSFLDVGTGTGILAIAAALKGGNPSDSDGVKISGYDIDPDSIKIAHENAATNNVDSSIEFRERSIDQDTPICDFVCANLTLDVIVPILPLLLAKSGKCLVLSGILEQQEELIQKLLKDNGVIRPHIDHSSEWIAVVVMK